MIYDLSRTAKGSLINDIRPQHNRERQYQVDLAKDLLGDFLRERYPPEQVAYYERNFSVNPVAGAQLIARDDDLYRLVPAIFTRWDSIEYYTGLEKDRVSYAYVKWFPVEGAESASAGIEIAALVYVVLEKDAKHVKDVSNRILVKGRDGTGYVSCIHTAIASVQVGDLGGMMGTLARTDESLLELARTTEHSPERLALDPVEHFVSLKSYVQGIAEMGVKNLILASYQSEAVNPETLPFGFNMMMQAQFVQALFSADRANGQRIMVDCIAEIARTVPPEWFESRLDVLSETYHFWQLIQNPEFLPAFKQIQQETGSKNLGKLIEGLGAKPEPILEFTGRRQSSVIIIDEVIDFLSGPMTTMVFPRSRHGAAVASPPYFSGRVEPRPMDESHVPLAQLFLERHGTDYSKYYPQVTLKVDVTVVKPLDRAKFTNRDESRHFYPRPANAESDVTKAFKRWVTTRHNGNYARGKKYKLR